MNRDPAREHWDSAARADALAVEPGRNEALVDLPALAERVNSALVTARPGGVVWLQIAPAVAMRNAASGIAALS